jgi:hypothetical protein
MGIRQEALSPSRADIIRKIRVPKIIDERLAELIGVHLGDGNIYEFRDKKRNQFSFTGSTEDDFEYYNTKVRKMIFRCFGVRPKFTFYGNWFLLRFCSKTVMWYFTKYLSIPSGNKASKITIPEEIKKSDIRIVCAFLRGLMDSDGTLCFKRKNNHPHDYPVMKITLASKPMISELRSLLSLLGFTLCVCMNEDYFDIRTNKKYSRHTIYLNGRDNLELWMNFIGFSNVKHKSKYLIWKRYGNLPPKTTLIQRKAILKKAEIHSCPGSSVWIEQLPPKQRN